MSQQIGRPAMLFLAAFVLFATFPAAQSASDYQTLKAEIAALKAQQQALQKQIDGLRVQGTTSAPKAGPVQPVNVVFQLDKTAIRGSESANVVLIEVADFECPFCGRHYRQTAQQIDKEFVDTGKIRHVFLNFPLDKHLNAFKASEAAACAGDQGKFWPMYDRLFSHQTLLGVQQLPDHATALGLQPNAFRGCLDSGKHSLEIRSEMAIAERAGVTATPTFFVGVFDPKSRTARATSRIVGAKSVAVFEDAINALLVPLAGGGSNN